MHPPSPAAAQARPAFPPARELLFLVPLIARRNTRDWGTVARCLARTLGSLLAQRDARWRAVVCGHDAPDLPDDPRIASLLVDTPHDGDDKWRKLRAILRHEAPGPATYLFALDADDLVHPGLVAHMLSQPHRDGWLISEGWSLDARTGALGRHGPPSAAHPKRAELWRVCGSAGAVRMVGTDPSATMQMLVDHWSLPEVAPRHGQTLTEIPFPAIAYLVAHGENQESRSGREDDKLRYIAANPAPPEEAREVRRLFALAPGPVA